MKIQALLFALLIFSTGLIQAQSPYHFNSKKEQFLISGSITLVAAGFYLSTETSPLTGAEINNLNIDDINSFDRFAAEKYSKTFQNLSDGLLAASFIAPIPLIFEKQIQNDFGVLAAMYAESFGLTAGVTLLTKVSTKRLRPIAYNSSVDLRERKRRDSRHSFFSGHTSISAMNSFFFAKVFSDYYPNSKYKPFVWTAAVLLPAATGYTRIEAGKHFPTDVLAGYAVGGLIGYFVPFFHKKKDKTADKVSFELLPNRIGVSLNLK